ncbi:hypothetical protein [Methylocella silvestris]|uniref:hypothetical protein n=1 Tax=Methylocella silvestris TaxID=199596 RepID=UPI0011AF5331|nr:hypothetical protein [Methylocella silvestris]
MPIAAARRFDDKTGASSIAARAGSDQIESLRSPKKLAQAFESEDIPFRPMHPFGGLARFCAS